MIVECPRCNARYRVEEEVLRDDPTFKCSRCSHIFAYEGGGEAPVAERRDAGASPPPVPGEETASPPRGAAVARERSRPVQESMSFSFAGRDGGRVARAEEPSWTDEEPSWRPPEPPPAPPREPQDDLAFDDDVEPQAATGPFVDHEPRFVRGEDELRVEEEVRGATGRSYLVFLGLLLLLFGNVALYLRNHPRTAFALAAEVPILGPMINEDRLLHTKIDLRDLEGSYQQIKDDKVVFIVSGRAVNTSPLALKGVQIESVLYDASAKPIETKSIYCGNAMSLKIVKDLSPKEISLLQRLEPPQRFEIKPGEAAGFSVVFMSPPPGLKEFSARVVSAQRAVS